MDTALNQVNKKTWNRTRRIMICNVLNFWSLIFIGICQYLHWNHLAAWAVGANAFTCSMALHFCWQLENEL